MHKSACDVVVMFTWQLPICVCCGKIYCEVTPALPCWQAIQRKGAGFFTEKDLADLENDGSDSPAVHGTEARQSDRSIKQTETDSSDDGFRCGRRGKVVVGSTAVGYGRR